MAKRKAEEEVPEVNDVTATSAKSDEAQESVDSALAVTAPSIEIPEGYEGRLVVLPQRYWAVFERFANRGGVTVNAWLERYFKHFCK